MNTQPIALVADMGGTNVRFALVDASLSCGKIQVLQVADHPTPFDAINAYLQSQELICPPLVGLAVACPADGEEIIFTNSHWRFNKGALLSSLGCEELVVINDFAALACGVPGLNREQLYQIGGEAPLEDGNIAVLGPGTGVGVAGLLNHHGQWLPIAGEGGHIEWAPLDVLEREIQSLLVREFPRLSVERVMQGSGLALLYQTVCAIRGETPATEQINRITELGLAGEHACCRETLRVYCNMLGSLAGDLSLVFGARGGVYIGGGIMPRLLEFVEHTELRQRFEHKGRMRAYNQRIPCFVITAPLRALDGVVVVLRMRGLLH